jgi:hypothetical protein
MAGNGFPAPWLNGRPIDAPNKIDLIDWYSQKDGYYPDATEHDSRNSVLRIFRTQGNILYDDEFHPESTVEYDSSQTIGRVERVFRAIAMMSKFKAACEDGADLLRSIIVLEIIWYDHKGKVLPPGLMHNLRKIEDQLKNRSPENSPVRAFWTGQEIQRSKWASVGPSTDPILQDHPNGSGDPTNSMAVTCYYDHHSGQMSYPPINQDHGFADPSMPANAYDLQIQVQLSSGWPNQELEHGNHGPQDPPKPVAVLDPTTAAFAPSTLTTSPSRLTPEASTQEGSNPGPVNPSSEPITLKTSLTVAKLAVQSQREYKWQDRDDEHSPDDHIFIPNFCRPIQSRSNPQLPGPGSERQNQIWTPSQSPIRTASPTPNLSLTLTRSPPTNENVEDSGYASGSPPPDVDINTAATNGDSDDDADGEITKYENISVDLGYPPEYRALKFEMGREENLRPRKEREALEVPETLWGSRSSVLTWLAAVSAEGWTWEGRMRHSWWLEL